MNDHFTPTVPEQHRRLDELTRRNNRFAFLDCESTGLIDDDITPAGQPKPEGNGTRLLEIYVRVMEADLATEVATFGPRVIHVPDDELAQMNDYVTEMHTRTGLLEKSREEGEDLIDVDEALTDFLTQHFVPKGTELPDGTKSIGIVAAGNSLGGLDMPLIRKELPEAARLFSYRVADITSLNLFLTRCFPGLVQNPALEKKYNHDAAGDVQESVNEVRALLAQVAPTSDAPEA